LHLCVDLLALRRLSAEHEEAGTLASDLVRLRDQLIDIVLLFVGRLFEPLEFVGPRGVCGSAVEGGQLPFQPSTAGGLRWCAGSRGRLRCRAACTERSQRDNGGGEL